MVRAERSPLIVFDEPGVRIILISMASEPVESMIGAVTTLAKLTLFALATSSAIFDHRFVRERVHIVLAAEIVAAAALEMQPSAGLRA